jgi:hypothetical protein
MDIFGFILEEPQQEILMALLMPVTSEVQKEEV